MPIYEYRCKVHGRYEREERINDSHKGKCSKCKRVFVTLGFSGDMPTTAPSFGRTRVEQETNLRSAGFNGMSDENFEKAKIAEEIIGKGQGHRPGFLRQSDLEMVK